MRSVEKLQNLIPLGYLFLVVMGILKESVFFYQLKINILKYSTIMDILISPIADLTANPIILICLVLFGIIIALLLIFFYKYRNKNWVKKIFDANGDIIALSNEEAKNKLGKIFILALSFGVLIFFLGLGVGGGHKIAKKIQTNKLEYKQKITFNTGETENIYLIDANSAYYFYVTQKSKSIKIAPIGAIKNIELPN